MGDLQIFSRLQLPTNLYSLNSARALVKLLPSHTCHVSKNEIDGRTQKEGPAPETGALARQVGG